MGRGGAAGSLGYIYSSRTVSGGFTFRAVRRGYIELSALPGADLAIREANAFAGVHAPRHAPEPDAAARPDGEPVAVARDGSRTSLFGTAQVTTARQPLPLGQHATHGARPRESTRWRSGSDMAFAGTATSGSVAEREPIRRCADADHRNCSARCRAEKGIRLPRFAARSLARRRLRRPPAVPVMRSAIYDFGYDALGGRSTATVDVAGGIVAIGGSLVATRPVQDRGFALVRVPGVGGVRAYLSNQLVGRTDRRGNCWSRISWPTTRTG